MGKDILIVEDEAAIREMVRFAIARAGFDAREAADERVRRVLEEARGEARGAGPLLGERVTWHRWAGAAAAERRCPQRDRDRGSPRARSGKRPGQARTSP